MKLFVGNLSRDTSADTVKNVFEQYGEVGNVRILFDRETRVSRGFGFVEMADAAQAKEAMANLNDTELEGRRIRVDEARESDRRDNNRGDNNRGGGFSRNRSGGGFRG